MRLSLRTTKSSGVGWIRIDWVTDWLLKYFKFKKYDAEFTCVIGDLTCSHGDCEHVIKIERYMDAHENSHVCLRLKRNI